MTLEEVPSWLTKDFLKDLLEISDDDEFHVVNIEYACGKGENFASKIYRVTLEFAGSGRKSSFIVKSRSMENGFSGEFVKKFNVFPKEIEMYKIIEKLENIYRSNGYQISFAPKCLKVTEKPTDVLIIEDMCAKGYRIAKMSNGLGKNEMNLVLEKLAAFHAASAVYYENHGNYEKRFCRGVYNNDMMEIFESHYDFNFKFLIDECFSSWPNLEAGIIDKMKNWRNYVLDELIRSMQPSKNCFNCLNHGDVWLSNILFKYDVDGHPQDCQFIDFQQSVFTSPVIDLMHLIFTSAQVENKIQNFEYYVKFYHANLVKALHDLKYQSEIPTLKQLQMEILDRGFYALWQCIAIMPVILMTERAADSCSENLIGEDEAGRNYKKALYCNERYRRHMTDLLTYFNNRGLVDLC